MMPFVRVTVGKLLAAALLALCLGAMALEATGRWDATFQDAGDEAAVIAVALCVGAAVAVAAATHGRVTFSLQSLVTLHPVRVPRFARSIAIPAFDTSPPLPLRI
jgi:hypothetical protein